MSSLVCYRFCFKPELVVNLLCRFFVHGLVWMKIQVGCDHYGRVPQSLGNEPQVNTGKQSICIGKVESCPMNDEELDEPAAMVYAEICG